MSSAVRAPNRDSGPPDSELLERVHLGDSDALGALYDRHAQGVYGFVRRLTSREDAEDVVQATFVRLTSIAGSFDARRLSARAWIHGVAYQVVRERRRSFRRLREVLGEYATYLLGRADVSSHDTVDVERALMRLGEKKRTVLVLTEVHGFTSEEVAAMLDLPVGTVWTRLHHARRELKAMLEGKTS